MLGSFFRSFPLFAILCAIILSSSPSFAQSAPASSAAASNAEAKAEIDRMIATIGDDASRAQLLEQLKVLSQAMQPPAPSPAEISAGLVEGIKTGIDDVAGKAIDAASALGDATGVLDWFQKELLAPGFWEKWLPILINLACVLVGGQIIEVFVAFLLRKPRRYMAKKQPSNYWGRIPAAALWWLLGLLPIAAFFVSAQTIRHLPIITLVGVAEDAAMVITLAYAMTRLTQVTLQFLFMPSFATIRLLPMPTSVAAWFSRWGNVVLNVVIWGAAIIKALSLLGMPSVATIFAQKAVGLAVAIILIVLTFANRHSVAAAIRNFATRRTSKKMVTKVIGRIASLWHLLADLYVIVLYVIWALNIDGGVAFVLKATGWTVLILCVSVALAELIETGVTALFRNLDRYREANSALARRSRHHMKIVKNVLLCYLCVTSALFLIQSWGMDIFGTLESGLGERVISAFVSICVALVSGALIWEFINSAIDRYLATTDRDGNLVQRSARAKTLLPLARKALTLVLGVSVGLFILSQLGVNITPLLAGAGVLGVAIGFGSQKLVQDFINGLFILMEDTIAVGDFVTIGSYSGTVESLSIRTLQLRDTKGQVHTLPFSSVSSISNSSRDYTFCSFSIGVGYREDVDEVLAVMRDLGDELLRDQTFGAMILAPMELFGLDQFGDNAIVINGRIKTMPHKGLVMGREFNRRLKKRFDELNIEFPYPCRTLYFGVDKQGGAEAANLRMVGEKEGPPASPVSLEKEKAPPAPPAEESPLLVKNQWSGKLPDQFSD